MWAEETLGEAWSRIPSPDPKDEEKRRLNQMIYLSHYASEPISAWDEKTVNELDDAYHALSRLIGLENGNKE